MNIGPTDAVATSMSETRLRLTAEALSRMPIHRAVRRLDKEAPIAELLALDERRPEWFLKIWYYVYRFYDADRRPLYIGASNYTANRLGDHRRNAEWWPLAEFIAISIYPSEEACREAERAAIRGEQPPFNTRHVRGRANVSLHVHGPAEEAAALLFREARADFIAKLAELLASPERFPQPEPPPAPEWQPN